MDAPATPHKTPIARRLLADLETPLSAYWKLAHDEPTSFLLESVSGGEQVARYSVIGVRPRSVVTADGDQIQVDGRPAGTGDPLAFVRDAIATVERGSLEKSLPKYIGGAVGMIGYDYVRQIEDIPAENPDELGLPDVAMMVCDSVVVFDHARAEIVVVALADDSSGSKASAEAEIERIIGRLKSPLPLLPSGTFPPQTPNSNMVPGEFEEIVERVREYIAAGDCIQVVASQRFSARVDAHPVTVYRALRGLNPSPFMFLLRFEGFDIVGASPELLVGLEGREASLRPIAGTRPRGETHAEDLRLAEELLADEKERAEHIMLVDLGRNDLGRVSKPGSVKVERLMEVEMYSHVMHIVSDVTSELAAGLDGVDLIRATFPAGTLSGAQKVRAMQIIEELESTKRGLYGGAVGTLSANGDVNLAIAIRTILIKDGMAHVQAGAGIVYDSVPAEEDRECANKARAALMALERAQAGIGF